MTEKDGKKLLPQMKDLILLQLDFSSDDLHEFSKSRSLSPEGLLTGSDLDPAVPCFVTIYGNWAYNANRELIEEPTASRASFKELCLVLKAT